MEELVVIAVAVAFWPSKLKLSIMIPRKFVKGTDLLRGCFE
jgi:hypothetical protein